MFFGRKPSVKSITAEEVYQLFPSQVDAEGADQTLAPSERHGEEFVLVDVRSEKEQAVSMIPGAITDRHFTEHRKQYERLTVITYCTVGVRSERFAQELIALGQSALNFNGSILAWCEAKLPLVTTDGQPTKRVHTYSARYKVPEEYTAVY